MLKSQPVPAEQGTASAARPPTTQEIAQAIAALEARKTSLNTDAVQTSTVSEIIDNLGLDMTAEDVLSEVQAQRARRWGKTPLTPATRKRLAVILAVGALAYCGVVWEALSGTPETNQPPAMATSSVYITSPVPLSLSPDTLVQDTTGRSVTMKTLAEIPDNYPVRCDIKRTQFADASNTFWTLVKHDGKPYLRCWMVPMSARAISRINANTGVSLFSSRGGYEGGVKATMPLTLAAESITVIPGDLAEGGPMLKARSVRLDSHAHEKWNP